MADIWVNENATIIKSSLEVKSTHMMSSVCLWRLRSNVIESQKNNLIKVVFRVDREKAFNHSTSSSVRTLCLKK